MKEATKEFVLLLCDEKPEEFIGFLIRQEVIGQQADREQEQWKQGGIVWVSHNVRNFFQLSPFISFEKPCADAGRNG